MMKKIIMVAVMVALFAGAVGVGVHVMHRDAHAINLEVSVEIFWNLPIDSWDVGATAQLLDATGIPIGDPIFLNPNEDFSEYIGTFFNVHSTAYKVRFTWDDDDEYVWNPGSGAVEMLNWSGVTTLNTTITGNWG